MRESCNNCKYKIKGFCHKNPPQLRVIVNKIDADYHLSEWPPVESNNYCGEWKAVNGVTDLNFYESCPYCKKFNRILTGVSYTSGILCFNCDEIFTIKEGYA